MAKNKDVVYVPPSIISKTQIEAPTKIDTPQYPDAGVDFGGYSKTIYSGNTYRLNAQNVTDINISHTFTGASFGLSILRANKDKKNFYCTKINISRYRAGAIVGSSFLSVYDGVSGRILMHSIEPTGAFWSIDLDFKVPLRFDTDISVSTSTAFAINDSLCLNFYGWEEDKQAI